MALNEITSKVKQYTSEDIQNCNKISNVYHCFNQMLNRNKEDSCLYNIFTNRIDRILLTCDVYLQPAKDTATQITGNSFRLFSSQPTQLTMACADTKLITFENMYILNLTDDCPTAYTDKHIFTYSSQYSPYNSSITIPTTANASVWMKDFIFSNINYLVERQYALTNQPIHYNKLKELYSNTVYNIFQIVKTYLHDIVLVIILLIFFAKSTNCVYNTLSAKCRTNTLTRRFQQDQPQQVQQFHCYRLPQTLQNALVAQNIQSV